MTKDEREPTVHASRFSLLGSCSDVRFGVRGSSSGVRGIASTRRDSNTELNMNTNREPGTRKSERLGAYNPGRRTALVLCGTGAHGVYHAGVLRALHETGVKIDLVAGQGVGAGGA